MKVDFLGQDFSNFKAFVGDHRLDWNAEGVTYVSGENRRQTALAANGSGKSSTSDALCWCLYSRTPNALKSPDVKPWQKADPTVVSQRIAINGKPHVITRSVNPNRLLLDGKEVAQDAIDSLIMPFELFVNTVLLAQGRPLFYDLGPQDKMALFAETLDLERWDTRSKSASSKASEAEEEVRNLEMEREADARGLEEVVRLLTEAKKSAEDWAARARTAAREAKTRIDELQRKHDDVNTRLGTARLREDSASTELRGEEVQVVKIRNDLQRVQLALTRLKLAQETAQDQYDEVREELVELKKAKVCPTCGQSVKASNLEEHKKHLQERLGKLKEAAEAPIPKNVSQTLKTLSEQLTQSEEHCRGFRGRADAAESEARRLQGELATLAAQLVEARRAAKEEATNPWTQQIATLTERQKKLKAVVASYEADIADAARRVERNRFWVKGFKDIKLQLIDDTLQELELVTNGMLDAVGLSDWNVRYDVERETKTGSVQRLLNVQISSPESKGFVKWGSWSGGEQQRLRLIGALALSDVLLAHAGVETNLEILDEPALYWSAEGVQELCAFLAERARETGKSIWYTEHQAVESTYFSQTLKVIKDKQGAYIEDR